MNQSELKANTCSRRQARENACRKITIGFGFLIGGESGAGCFSQLQTVVMQNQSNCEITFDTQLKSAVVL